MTKEYRIRMPIELYEGLQEAAKLKGMTSAGICREAIAAYLKVLGIDYGGRVHLSWGGTRPGAGRPERDPGQGQDHGW